MKRIRYEILLLIVFSACLMAACSDKDSGKIQSGKDIIYTPTTTVQEETSDSVKYDVKDLAVVINVDTDNTQIVLKSLQDNEKYILTYTGACDVTDKYGDIMAMSQLNIGEIVDAYYLNSENKITRITISNEAFEYKNVSDFSYSEEDTTFIFRDSKYSFDENLVVISDGYNIKLSEVSSVDELTVKGVGKKVNCIIVTRGHGYIKLDKTDYFEGGIIEIGKKMMLLITKDMLITAPEGTYNITATIDGSGGTKEVTVKKDEEVKLSLTEFQGDAVRYGSYSFDITPSDATLTIDGKKTSYESLVDLTYGSHEIVVSADGYDTYTASVIADSVFESLTINLTEESTDSNEETTTSSEDYLIYVDAPEDAEVYFDGIYKGVAPVSFEKATGKHIVTLRRTGYSTQMYTLEIAEENKDVHFVLPDMTEIEE